MRTNEWYVSVGMILITYLAFALLPNYRLFTMIIFSFVFAAIIARDEWRLGRIVLRSVVPLFISVVLLFSIALVSSSLDASSPLSSGKAPAFALACIALLVLCALVGVPLAWLGAQTRRFSNPSVE